MAETFNYFAFGSNLTRARLFARVGICDVVGTATIAGHSMSFRKRSHDGTAKCDLYETDADDVAEGVVFSLPASKKAVLDRFEGVGAGYEVVSLAATLNHERSRQPIEVVAYQAQPPWITDDLLPFCWYRDFVLEGGRAFGLSAAWMNQILSQSFMPDPNAERRQLNESILSMSDQHAHQMSIDGGSS